MNIIKAIKKAEEGYNIYRDDDNWMRHFDYAKIDGKPTKNGGGIICFFKGGKEVRKSCGEFWNRDLLAKDWKIRYRDCEVCDNPITKKESKKYLGECKECHRAGVTDLKNCFERLFKYD